MINTNKLMVGNWYIAPNGKETILTIDLLKEIIELEWFGDIEPIELNDEWLYKLGFSKEGTNYWYHEEKTYMEFHNGFLISCDHSLNQTEITYVHELQNLYYSITKEELKIK